MSREAESYANANYLGKYGTVQHRPADPFNRFLREDRGSVSQQQTGGLYNVDSSSINQFIT